MTDKEIEFIAQFHDEVHRENERKYTDVLRFLLTVSLTLLTLLLPLAIFLAGKEQNRFLIAGAVALLTLSCLTSLRALLMDIRKAKNKEDYLRALLVYAKGRGTLPETEYKSHLGTLRGFAIVSGICFGLAVLLLCGTLFLLIFS